MIDLSYLGRAALLSSLVLACFGLIAAALGLKLSRPSLVSSATKAAVGVAAFTSFASAVLFYAFLTHDFSLKYVVQTSSLAEPTFVVLTGFWGGQAGSLLLWAWGLTILTAIVVGRDIRPRALVPGVVGTLLTIQIFFLGMLNFVSNPFEPLPSPAADGQGLNPLLWDVGMRIHPPLLLSGFMSFAVPFAFAMAAMITGRLGREWLVAVRRWILLSWAIQGLGLLAGAWWAYHVLGWGGYWGWDPVENVALLPWLTSTALLHSTMVQERRGTLKVWNLGLVIAGFALAIFGTFVVRSGILSSVHSFAQSPLGPYFLGFLVLALAVPLVLLFHRLPLLRAENAIEGFATREGGFLLNNLLLTSVAAATFWGTVFPLVAEAATGAKVSVGAPFYQQVDGPLFLGLIVLMGVGPLLAWQRTAMASLWRGLRGPLVVAVVTGIALFALGVREGLAVIAIGATVFTLAVTALEYWHGARARRRNTGESYPAALVGLVRRGRRRYGGYLVHLGILLIAFGVIGSSYYQKEATATLSPGQSMTVGRYTFDYRGVFVRSDLGVQVEYASVAVTDGGNPVGVIYPDRRTYLGWENSPVTGVSITTTSPRLDDLYVLLTDWDEQGRATLRVFVNPLVSLLWLGGVVFLLGTLLAAWPEPSRQPVRVRSILPPRVVANEG